MSAKAEGLKALTPTRECAAADTYPIWHPTAIGTVEGRALVLVLVESHLQDRYHDAGYEQVCVLRGSLHRVANGAIGPHIQRTVRGKNRANYVQPSGEQQLVL